MTSASSSCTRTLEGKFLKCRNHPWVGTDERDVADPTPGGRGGEGIEYYMIEQASDTPVNAIVGHDPQ